MVLSKNGHFSNFFFLGRQGQKNVFNDILERKNAFLGYKNNKAIKGRKMSFRIFWNEKSPFSAIKTRSWKSRRIDIFPKGLTHGFCPKMAIFLTLFFLGNEGQKKCLLRYSRTKKKLFPFLLRKNAFLSYKNKKLRKSKNWHFFKGVNP